jgi:hypothetical protein
VKTLPKNLIALLSRAGTSTGNDSGGTALAGDGRAAPVMGMREKQKIEGEVRGLLSRGT